MSGIFGHLNVSDSDRVFENTVGQRVIYEAAMDYINRANADLESALSIFVDSETEDYKLRYKLPAGGYLEQRGPDGRYGTAKAYGEWDVAFPLKDFGRIIAGNDVDMAYMTVGELDLHLRGIAGRNVNTVRAEVLHKLMDNVADSFTDPRHGSLTIQPLANDDGTEYPPVLGGASDVEDDHYLESGYAASAISDSNNPYTTIKNELEEHFGAPTGGSNLVVFIHTDEVPETEDLTDFDPVNDRFIRPGDDADLPINLPGGVPGRIVGRTNGVWVVEWRWVTSGYMLAVHADAPKPLMKRRDPADTGLPTGLNMVAEDEQFPFQEMTWRHRFGFGCGNRLNGVVMELSDGGSYTVPTAYT